MDRTISDQPGRRDSYGVCLVGYASGWVSEPLDMTFPNAVEAQRWIDALPRITAGLMGWIVVDLRVWKQREPFDEEAGLSNFERAVDEALRRRNAGD